MREFLNHNALAWNGRSYTSAPQLPPWPGHLQLYSTFVLEANFTSTTNQNRGVTTAHTLRD